MEQVRRAAILGLGKMGEALAKGLGGRLACGTTRSQASADDAAVRLGITVHTDNRRAAEEAEVLLLCVKPAQVAKVLGEIRPVLTDRHLLISVAAAVTTAQLHDLAGGKTPVIRAMSNTPALIGLGMTALAPHESASPEQLELATTLFEGVGKVVQVEEHLMDAVTGLSGCGPAYVYMIIEALSEAGVMVGLPRKTATLLATQTILGATTMVVERGAHPAALKDEVTTPAGCTIDGLMQLEEGKLRATLIRAVVAATSRSKTLAGPKPPH